MKQSIKNKLNFRKPNGHISSYEIMTLYDWLLTDKKERKEAVFAWTSGLARYIGYIIEKYYKQVKNPRDYPKYKETFSTDPFMCLNCLKEQKEFYSKLHKTL